jgi:uncharacterized damage-inducible protein DinB
MTETAEQYKARFRSYTEGRDTIAMQRQTARELASLIDSATDAELKRSPAPGKWSVTQIIAHMAEDELVSTWRYRQMLEADGVHLPGFDQDLWAKLGDYSSWTASDALSMFRLLREANMRMLARLTPEQWSQHGFHAERGKITVRDLCDHMAAHDMNHLEQLKKILGH